MGLYLDKVGELDCRIKSLECVVRDLQALVCGNINDKSSKDTRDMLIDFAEYLKETKGFSKHRIPMKVDEYLSSIKVKY